MARELGSATEQLQLMLYQEGEEGTTLGIKYCISTHVGELTIYSGG